jgi:hypothetical protein
VKILSPEEAWLAAVTLVAGVAYGDVRIADVCYLQAAPGRRVADDDEEEPNIPKNLRHTEGCYRRWEQQVEIAGVCKRRKGCNVWR